MRIPLPLISASCTVLLLACSPTAPREEAQPATQIGLTEVKAATEARAKALEAGDVEGFLAVYNDDAVWLPPHSEMIVGKESARSRVAELMGRADISYSVDSQEMGPLGPGWVLDWGSFVSTITNKDSGQAVEDAGSYLTLWQQGADGSWRIAYDIWNSDRPLPEAGGK